MQKTENPFPELPLWRQMKRKVFKEGFLHTSEEATGIQDKWINFIDSNQSHWPSKVKNAFSELIYQDLLRWWLLTSQKAVQWGTKIDMIMELKDKLGWQWDGHKMMKLAECWRSLIYQDLLGWWLLCNVSKSIAVRAKVDIIMKS